MTNPIIAPDETTISMDGPTHYELAEKLVHFAANVVPDDEPAQAALTARAQVHATLAVADNLASVFEALWNRPSGSAR